MEKVIKSERHQATFLYGSCSRGEEKYGSNVDLLLVLNENFDRKLLRKEMRMLQANVSTDNLEDPEVDMKIVIGNQWEKSRMLYYQNIRKEGKKVKLIDGFYFSTRYPGEESVMPDSEDIEECKEAVAACRRETLEWINGL